MARLKPLSSMNTTHIPADVRRQVIERAQQRCEYCSIHEDDSYFGMQVDHVISEKHGGATELGNLALACVFCNRAKGSDIGSLDRERSRSVLWPYRIRLNYLP